MTMTATPTTTSEQEGLRSLAVELLARDRWSREQLLAHQRLKLRDLIRHAVAESAYYREAFGPGAADGEVSLDELPTLPKALLMEQFDRVVTDPRLRRTELEAFLTGREAGVLFRGRYRVFATSGTSGLLGIFAFDRDEFRLWVASCLRGLGRVGVTAETRLAAIGAPGAQHVTRQLFAAFMAGRSGSPRLTVTTPLAEMVAALNEYQPEAIVTYAGVGAVLAEEQLQGRLRIDPSLVVVGSEVLTEDAEQRMADAWGNRPCNVYAATEAPPIALSSTEHPGLSVFEDFVIVEVVDEDGREVPPGMPGHKVLLTNLVNRAQPLIRYELADSLTMADGLDPSGLPFLRIERVDGRNDDILRFPARGGGQAILHPFRLRSPFTRLPDVLQYQVVKEPERLRVRVVLRSTAPGDMPAVIREALRLALEEAGAIPPPIEVEPVAQLEREPGEGAKLKLVKSQR